MATRAQQFDSGKEVTEDNGMGAKILEATNDPASSAIHIEPPGAENVMKSRDSHHSLWSHALWQQRSRHSELPRPSMGAWYAHLRFWSKDLGMARTNGLGRLDSILQTTAADASSSAQATHCLSTTIANWHRHWLLSPQLSVFPLALTRFDVLVLNSPFLF